MSFARTRRMYIIKNLLPDADMATIEKIVNKMENKDVGAASPTKKDEYPKFANIKE